MLYIKLIKGLEYLHMSPIGYHGSLTPWACVIDRNWSVRLTDYGIANPLERWEKDGAITIEKLKSDDDKSQAAQRTSMFKKMQIEPKWVRDYREIFLVFPDFGGSF
jgi:hypothetical protein